jgi:hypothetical protein
MVGIVSRAAAPEASHLRDPTCASLRGRRARGSPCVRLYPRLPFPDSGEPMAKLILLSIVLFTSILPALLCTTRSPTRALRWIHVLTIIAVFCWAYGCRVWYPQLVTVEQLLKDEE